MALPVVLLHAFPLSSRMFEPLRADLPGIELLTPDYAPSSSLDALADDVAALLDARGVERAIIGGVSMGGYLTLAFLRRHRSRAAAVVLADTKADADSDATRANRFRIAQILDDERSGRVLLEEVLPTLIGETTKRKRPRELAFVTDLVASASPASAAAWQRAMAGRPDSFDTLRATDAPALVVVGSEDSLAPPERARAMADALPHSTIVELPAAGHLSAVETPDAFAAALTGFVGGL
jgi:pimeloyl-ACP methyl ester carboxylesterase